MRVTAEAVKTLRAKTGAGMMECKRALQENQGDVGRAIEWLRKHGLKLAEKKVGRAVSEGMIGAFVAADETAVALVEVNCETDFVCRTSDFQQFAAAVAECVGRTEPADLPALLGARLPGGTVAETQTELIARIGENIGVRRFACRRVDGVAERLASYVHTGHKIGVAVAFADPARRLAPAAARDIAMHVAAMQPRYVRREAVPAAVAAKEREIVRAQLADENKPPEVLEKIVTGRLNKYFVDVCLEEQIFVKDPEGKRNVAQVLKAIDPQIQITDFLRMQVGEDV